jgi:hypothetical protein
MDSVYGEISEGKECPIETEPFTTETIGENGLS